MTRRGSHTVKPDVPPPPANFTPPEIRAFKYHALLVAGIAVGLYSVATKGTGQWLGVLFAVALLPIPPLVIYLLRRRRAAK